MTRKTLKFGIKAQALFVQLSATRHLMYSVSGLINSEHVDKGERNSVESVEMKKMVIQQDENEEKSFRVNQTNLFVFSA
jgi:hypothetical protein